mmetsp:Transcript_63329/g.141168  ORF Transcript_63329/g.141168 Transcript_63329/m.141168 type:complete len:158 (-) Transcript_63329:921-1394(-)
MPYKIAPKHLRRAPARAVEEAMDSREAKVSSSNDQSTGAQPPRTPSAQPILAHTETLCQPILCSLNLLAKITHWSSCGANSTTQPGQALQADAAQTIFPEQRVVAQPWQELMSKLSNHTRVLHALSPRHRFDLGMQTNHLATPSRAPLCDCITHCDE